MNKRPVLYSAASFLSCIGNSLAILFFFFIALFFDLATDLINSVTNLLSMEHTFTFYFVMLAVLYTFSLIGILRMLKYHASGFFIYLPAQVAILVLPVIVIDSNAFSISNAILTILFVTIQLFHFFWIRRFIVETQRDEQRIKYSY